MKEVAEELKLSVVDIFNIIATPTISFLAQDATELCRLILNHGIPKTTDDDAERGGEQSNIPVWKIDAEKTATGPSNPGTPIMMKKRSLASSL